MAERAVDGDEDQRLFAGIERDGEVNLIAKRYGELADARIAASPSQHVRLEDGAARIMGGAQVDVEIAALALALEDGGAIETHDGAGEGASDAERGLDDRTGHVATRGLVQRPRRRGSFRLDEPVERLKHGP